MRKVIMVGHVACGKTTLCQCLNGMEMKYKKTQALEVIHKTIDTPGEYVERRSLFSLILFNINYHLLYKTRLNRRKTSKIKGILRSLYFFMYIFL